MDRYGVLFESIISEADRDLVAQASEFGRAHFTEENIQSWYAEGGIPESTMRAFKESGLGYLGLSSVHHGNDVPFFSKILVLEELSRISGTMLPINSQIVTFNTFSQLATMEQIDFVLEKYEETARPCFSYAFTDASNEPSAEIHTTRIEKKDGRLVINGLKSFVNNGEYAPYVFALARNMTESDDMLTAPLTFWLVPKDAPGVTLYPIGKTGQRLLPAAAIEFANVEIDPEWQIGKANVDKGVFSRIVNSVRCTACANSLGMAQAALEDAAYYAEKRIINEHRLVEYGQIAEKLTDMQAGVSSMRYLTYESALSVQNNDEHMALTTAMLKKYVPGKAVEVANDGMSILGGISYTDATRMSRIWIDCRGNQFSTGTDEVMALSAARRIAQFYS